MSVLLKDKYKIIRELGSGAMGTVYLCEFEENSRQIQVAVKRISQFISSGAENKYIQKELQIIQYLIDQQNSGFTSENVLKCYEIFQENEDYFMVSEYCSNGDLYFNLSHFHSTLTIITIIEMAKQIIKGILSLHSIGITHRDLKPENILVSQEQGRFILKITDFGISSIQNMKSAIGTINYMSPEIIRQTHYSNKVDIWSFGCLLYEIIYNEYFFNQQSQVAVARAILNFKQYHSKEDRPIYKELNILISKCLNINPDERPTPNQILEELNYIESLMLLNNQEQIKLAECNDSFISNRENPESRSEEISKYETSIYGEKQEENNLLSQLISELDTPIDDQLLKKRNREDIIGQQDIQNYKQSYQLNEDRDEEKEQQKNKKINMVIVLLHIIMNESINDYKTLMSQLKYDVLSEEEYKYLIYYLIQCILEDNQSNKINQFFNFTQNNIFQQIFEKLITNEKYMMHIFQQSKIINIDKNTIFSQIIHYKGVKENEENSNNLLAQGFLSGILVATTLFHFMKIITSF